MGKQGFRGLRVWQEAKTLAVDIYAATRSSSELGRDFSLRDQMQRSAVSICSNIAEGDERDSDKDAVRFFYIAKGSAAELITQLEIARDAGLLVAAVAEPLIERSEVVSRKLGALIQARKPFSPSRP